MGNWYTNVSVKGARQSDIVAALEELGRRAYVAPGISGWIVVYDQQTDDFDLSLLESLALTLSTRLSCTALASCNADDDVLWLALYNLLEMPRAAVGLGYPYVNKGETPEGMEREALRRTMVG